MRVLETGGIWVVLVLLFDAVWQREKAVSWPNIFSTAIAGFLVGMMFVFEWRVLHGWNAVIFVAVIVVALCVGIIVRRARNRAMTR
jgi:hypothetical protein